MACTERYKIIFASSENLGTGYDNTANAIHFTLTLLCLRLSFVLRHGLKEAIKDFIRDNLMAIANWISRPMYFVGH